MWAAFQLHAGLSCSAVAIKHPANSTIWSRKAKAHGSKCNSAKAHGSKCNSTHLPPDAVRVPLQLGQLPCPPALLLQTTIAYAATACEDRQDSSALGRALQHRPWCNSQTLCSPAAAVLAAGPPVQLPPCGHWAALGGGRPAAGAAGCRRRGCGPHLSTQSAAAAPQWPGPLQQRGSRKAGKDSLMLSGTI